MSNWRQLPSRTIVGLEELKQQGQAVPEWILGGGTALMLHANHRLSKDIDAFIDDPQYLGVMSPRVTEVWNCQTWDEAAHYLKLIYAEGEIDFIVSAPLSRLGTDIFEVDLTDLPALDVCPNRFKSGMQTSRRQHEYPVAMHRPPWFSTTDADKTKSLGNLALVT
ncbi:nucleotidyl transferase AbiEii/AbiGii toxin family protein [Bradyrhizobium sp. UFLA05-112]